MTRRFAVLKLSAIVAGALVVSALGAIAFIELYWDHPAREPARELKAPGDAETLARGNYLYNEGMLCWTCHGSRGGRDANEPQAGGKLFDMRSIGPGFGKVWSSNLTADASTGIGNATDSELVRAIREGIDQRGKLIFPVMAYQFYRGLSDDDALALVAYMRTFAPVKSPVPPRQLSFAARALIAFGQIKPEPPVATRIIAPPKGVTIEYGRYLTWHASGCAECHSPRFPDTGQLDRSRLLGGGLFAFLEEGFTTTATNLTPDNATGLGRWSEAEFVRAVRTGVRPDGTVLLPFMPWPSYSGWSDADLSAVWLYLRSIPAVSHAVPPSILTGRAADGGGASHGEGLFEVYCVTCHGQRGRGGSLSFIPLASAADSVDDNALRAIIEEGLRGTVMPSFGRTLSAEQMRDLIAFIRSW